MINSKRKCQYFVRSVAREENTNLYFEMAAPTFGSPHRESWIFFEMSLFVLNFHNGS
jgi:hypothetical protein